jgi:hypothetical protein
VYIPLSRFFTPDKEERKKEREKQTPQRTDDNDATPKKKNKSWKLKARKEAKNTEIIQGI